MRNAAGYTGQFAPYPAVGYPLADFAGAGSMSPRRGTGGAQAMATGGVNQNNSPVERLLPSAVARSAPLAIIVVVFGGYLIWHISSKV